MVNLLQGEIVYPPQAVLQVRKRMSGRAVTAEYCCWRKPAEDYREKNQATSQGCPFWAAGQQSEVLYRTHSARSLR